MPTSKHLARSPPQIPYLPQPQKAQLLITKIYHNRCRLSTVKEKGGEGRSFERLLNNINIKSCRKMKSFYRSFLYCFKTSFNFYSTQLRKSCVLGFCGFPNTSSGVPSSIIYPLSINRTLSATSRAKPIS